jgi:hypothetical protein
MAWGVDPRTWSVPLLVTAAILNAEVRDKLMALKLHTHSGAAGDGSADIVPTSITMGAGMLQQSKGANLTAAGTMTLGSDGNYFNVTGTTTINNMTAKQAGTVIILHFASALTITHGGGFTLQSGGNWAAPAGSVLVLVSDGSGAWTEVTRWVGGTIPQGVMWVPVLAVSGAASAPAVVGSHSVAASIGTGAADGTAHFEFAVPSDWSTTTKAVVRWLGSGGSGRTERYKVDAEIGGVGALFTASAGTIAATNITGVSTNIVIETDVSAALSGIVAGSQVGLAFTNLASSTTGGAQQDAMNVLGFLFQWRA